MKPQELNPNKASDLTAQLQELFEFAEPNSLRRSLNHVFFNYLLNNKDSLPQDFDTITGDFYFLINFLDKVELKPETKS